MNVPTLGEARFASRLSHLSPRAIGLVIIIIGLGLVGLILANWQERRALKALRERCPGLPRSISGVMAMLITLFGVLALIGALLR
jgi:uncharacterized membrane protein YidH (DUF202 family)